MGKVHVHICLHNVSIISTAGSQTRLLPGKLRASFLLARSSFFAEAFQNDYVTACNNALRGATEKNKSGGYVTVLCPSKTIQRSSRADWLKF